MATETYLSFSVKFSILMSIVMGSFRASLLFELHFTPIVVKAYQSKVNYKLLKSIIIITSIIIINRYYY